MGVAQATLLNGHRSYHLIESGFKRAWSHSCSRALISDIPDSVDNDTYTGECCLKMVTSMTNGAGSCRNEPFLRSFRLGSLLPISLSRRNVDSLLHIGYILTEDIIGSSGRFMPKEVAALEHACPRVSPTGRYPTFPTTSTSRLYLGGVLTVLFRCNRSWPGVAEGLRQFHRRVCDKSSPIAVSADPRRSCAASPLTPFRQCRSSEL